MFAEVEERFGRLDGLVNNAARFTRRDALEITERDWDFIHSVNLKAVFFCCQNGARLMKKSGGGRIVNISLAGGIPPGAEARALLRLEGRGNHANARAGQGFRAGDHGELGGAGVIPFEDIDERGKKMIASHSGRPRRHAGGGRRRGGLLSESVQLRHRADAGGGRGTEPAVAELPRFKPEGRKTVAHGASRGKAGERPKSPERA